MKFKKTIAGFLACILLLGNAMPVKAQTQEWNLSKTPGCMNSTVGLVRVPAYKGNFYMKATHFTGECSYLVAKCSSAENYVWITNSSQSVQVSRSNMISSFRIAWSDNTSQFCFNLKCYLEHNAGIGEIVSGVGVVYY